MGVVVLLFYLLGVIGGLIIEAMNICILFTNSFNDDRSGSSTNAVILFLHMRLGQ